MSLVAYSIVPENGHKCSVHEQTVYVQESDISRLIRKDSIINLFNEDGETIGKAAYGCHKKDGICAWCTNTTDYTSCKCCLIPATIN